MNTNFSLSSKLSLDIKTSQCFITENGKGNLLNGKYYLTKGILQFTVFFDHPVVHLKINPRLSEFLWAYKEATQVASLPRCIFFVSPEDSPTGGVDKLKGTLVIKFYFMYNVISFATVFKNYV